MKYSEYKEKKYKVKPSDDFREKLKEFSTGYTKFVKTANDDYSNIGYKNASAQRQKYSDSTLKLRDDVKNLMVNLNAAKDSMKEEDYNSLKSYLDDAYNSLGQISSEFSGKARDFSQFDTEEDYNKYSADWLNPEGETNAENASARQGIYNGNKTRIAEIDDLIEKKTGGIRINTMAPAINYEDPLSPTTNFDNPIDNYDSDEVKELRKEKDKLEAENRQYERTQKTLDEYYHLQENEDFDTVSAKRDFVNPAGEYEGWGWQDGKAYDALGNEIEIQDKLGIFLEYLNKDKDPQFLYGSNTINYDSIQEGSESSWEELKPEEIGTYYYLMNTEGQESAYKFLDSLTTELNRRSTAARDEEIAEANALEKILLNVASVPANLLGGVSGIIEDTVRTAQGKDINPYSSAHSFSNFATSVRTHTAEDINDWTGNDSFLTIQLGDVYQSLMSGADSFVAGGLFGPAGASVLLGTNAATSEAKRLYEEGASSSQIAWGGLLAGAAETVFEKVSLDRLLDPNITSKTKLQVVKNALIQGGVEASEEAFTEIANKISDIAVRGSQADTIKLIDGYISEGKSQGEATLLALKDTAGDVWQSAVGGFISGGAMGGVQQTASHLQYNSYATKTGQQIINDGGYNALRQLANDISGVDDADSKLINKFAKSADKKQSAKNVGKLSDAVESARVNRNKADIASELQGKGLNKKEANKVARYMSDTINGVALSETEQDNFENILANNSDVADTWFGIIGTVDTDTSSHSINKRNAQHNFGRTGLIETENGIEETEYTPKSVKNVLDVAREEVPGSTIIDAADRGKGTVTSSEGEESNVRVKKISSIENGTINLELDNGDIVKASDVLFNTEDEVMLYETVSKLDLNVQDANAFIEAYYAGNNMPVQSYVLGFEEAHKYGKYNYPKNQMSQNGFSFILSNSQREFAYDLGKAYGERVVAEKQKALDSNKSTEKLNNKKNKGKMYYDDVSRFGLSERQKESIKGLKIISKALGVDIHLYESKSNDGNSRTYTRSDGTVTTANGWYDTNTGDIYLDINAGNKGDGVMLFTAAHELTHFIKEWSPAKFKILADFLMEQYGKKGVSVDDLVQRQISKAQENGRDLSYDEAYEEVIADSCESLLADGDVIKKLAELKARDNSLFKKIVSFINDLVAKIENVYAGLNPDSAEGKFVKDMVDEAENLKKIFADALADAGDTYSKVDSANGGEVFFSDRPFAEQVDEVLDGKFDRTNAVYVGMTPQILQDVGLNGDLPMLTTASHIRNANKPKNTKKHHHGLTEKQIKNIPEKIAHPVMIMDSLDETRNSIVVVTDMLDIDKSPIVVSIKTDGKGMYNNVEIDSNFLTGYYGRDGFANFIENNVASDTFLYINKEKATTLSTESSTSWLEQLKNYDFNVIIRKTRANVKENDVKFSDRDYSYEVLTNKPDMSVTILDNNIPDNRADVIALAKKNATSIGKRNKDGSVSVYVDDVGKDVFLATKGLSHGLRRINKAQTDPNFAVTLKAGEIIKNSIKINEILPSKELASMSYVLIGVANNTNGDLYIVRSIVNQFNHELDSMDILYAINAKKEELAATKSPRLTAKPLSVTSSTISISDLLDYVNRFFPNVLPESVLKHYNYTERPEGDLGQDVLYSERDTDSATKYEKENKKLTEDVKNLKKSRKKEKYWYSNLSASEMATVRRIAKYELSTTENYIDNNTKWLYNERNGKPFFALYSTADENDPTILYASKSVQAVKDNSFFVEFLDTLRSVNDGRNIEQGSEMFNQVLENFWNDNRTNSRNIATGLGQGNRNVRISNSKSDYGPQEALFNCLRNIGEIQERDDGRLRNDGRRRDGVNKYSERDTDTAAQYEKVNRQLTKENEKLTEDVENLKELLRLQGKETHGKVMKKSSLEAIAKKIMRDSKAKGDVKEFTNLLGDVYEYILQGEDVSWEGISDKANGAIDWLIKNEVQKQERTDEAKEILSFFRNYSFSITDDVKPDIAFSYGSYNDYRKRAMGSLKIKNDAPTLDSLWGEICKTFPNRFDIETTDKDQPKALLDVIEEMKTSYVLDYGYDEDMIRQSLLTLIYDSYWNVSTLHTVADVKQKEINLLKYKHAKQMAFVKKSHFDAVKELKSHYNERLKTLIKQKNDRYDEMVLKYREQRKNATDRRYRTIKRNKIKSVVNELNKLLNRGTKERNVKLGLQDAIGKALRTAEVLFSTEITNADIVRLGVESVTPAEEKALKKYAELLDTLDKTENETEIKRIKGQISGLNTRLKDLFVRERARLNRETVSNALDALALAYADLKNSTDDYVKNNAYVEGMREKIVNLSNDLQGVTIKDMSYEQLKSVYDMYAMVKHMVQQANSIFREGKYEDLMTNISNVQMELDEISSSTKDSTEIKEKIADFLRGFTWNELKPYAAFERLGSQTFQKLFWDVVEADNVWARDIEEAKNVIESARKKYGFKKWNTQKAVTIKSANGLDFKLTLEDMMSIYAYSKRPQAEDHMTDGGFVFDTGSTYKEKKGKITKTYKHKKLSETYRVDHEVIQAVMKELAKVPGAMKYVDEVQGYLTKLGEKGNEVSRVMFGIDLFKEKVYFPLQSAADYRSSVEQTLNATQTMASLKNIGMSKETVPQASNPIVLKSFDDVVLEHINNMAKYHAYVVPIENLSKVFNNVAKGSGEYISTQALIASKFGESAKRYFDQFITDLNGGSFGGGASNPLANLFATAKAVAVGANLSVVVQQYFAIVRAMDEVNPKYFVPFLNGEASKTDAKQYEELKKYAPVAVIKEIGGFDMSANRSALSYMGDAETRLDGKKVRSKIKEDAMYLPGKMDELGWSTIWRAVKKEVADTTNFKVGSEEFLNACGKRFTEIVAKTQVYDSVTSRSGFMRSKHETVKYLTSFMGEPTAIINSMFTKQLKLHRALKSKNKAEIKKASAGLARTSTVLILSTVLTSFAKSLPYAMRDDDEEDKSLLERWAKHFGEAIFSDINPLNMIPVGRDLVSIWDGWDVERPDITLISDIVTSFKKAIDEGCTTEEAMNFAGALANVLGYPLKNVVRDVKGFARLFGDIADDIEPTDIGGAFAEGFMGEDKSKLDRLYDVIIDGDAAKEEVLKSNYDTDTEYINAQAKAIIANDREIVSVASDYINEEYSTYDAKVDELIAQGFSPDAAAKAIQNIKSMVESAAQAEADGDTETYEDKVGELLELGYDENQLMRDIEFIDAEPSDETEKAKSRWNKEDYVAAVINGDTSMAAIIKTDIIATQIANGKTEEEAEKSFISSLKEKIKDAYIGGEIDVNKAQTILEEDCGMDDDEIYWLIDEWDYALENETSDGYAKYNDFFESVRSGKNLKSVINEYVQNGVKKSTLASRITSHFKPLYRDMSKSERANIKGYLLNAYSVLGYDRAKKSKDIDKWLED